MYTFVVRWCAKAWPEEEVTWGPTWGSACETGGQVSLSPPLPAVWAEGLARQARRESCRTSVLARWLKVGRMGRRGVREHVRQFSPERAQRAGAGSDQSATNGVRATPTYDRLSRFVRRHLRELACKGVRLDARPYEPAAVIRPPDRTGMALPWSADEVVAFSAGRLLTPSELQRRLLRAKGLPFADRRPAWEVRQLVELCFTLAEQGTGRVHAAVRWEGGSRLRCRRCHQAQLTPWPCQRCGQPACFACDGCSSLGVLRSCDILYEGTTEPARTRGFRPSVSAQGRWLPAVPALCSLPGLPVVLSPAQQDAAQALVRFVQGSHSPSRGEDGQALGESLRRRDREALLWAVCGAGKTEVAFAAVRHVLGAGGRVLFAVPRRDVVAELGPRLAEYAAPCPVETLYGGAPFSAIGHEDGAGLAPLVVATTHQCLRFGSVFDLVIVDEIDAYPLRTERFLQEGLRNTLAPGGLLVTMSATPEASRLRRARSGALTLITIPARHHGYPLPVPQWVCDKGMRQGESIDRTGQRNRFVRYGRATWAALEQCLLAGPTIAFVPTVALAEASASVLAARWQQRGGLRRVSFVHSRDPQRDAKIAAFRRGELDVLVATTVMERGITVAGAQVAVLFADDEAVYDERTLVQMAGRVGRSSERPGGHVFFIGRRRTAFVGQAIAQIRELNARARRGGYLRP